MKILELSVKSGVGMEEYLCFLSSKLQCQEMPSTDYTDYADFLKEKGVNPIVPSESA
jgi:hypothetical protein